MEPSLCKVKQLAANFYTGACEPAFMSMMKGLVMTDWQQTCETVTERDSFILHHEMWTDCVFIVGKDKKEFKVHRLMLAKSSPAMAAMLYGPLYEKDEPIFLPDITAAAFSSMLLYMYKGCVHLDNFEVACELLYASKKYLLHASLLARLRAFLWRSIYPDNMWRALTFASNNDEPRLLETALQIIQLKTFEALRLDSFLEISQSQLVSLVQCDQLAVHSELELYEANVRWSRRDVQRRGEEETAENLREALAPIIPHIRFLTMKQVEFTNGPALGDVLNLPQKFGIMMVLGGCHTATVPENISSVRSERKTPNFESFFVFGTDDKQRKLEACKNVSDGFNLENSYDVLSTAHFCNGDIKPYTQLGVVIPTQLKEPDAGGEDSYDEDLTILLIKEPEMKVLSATRFTSRVKYNSTVQVPYKEKFVPKPGTMLNVKVVFHKSGRYQAKLDTGDHKRFYVDLFDGTENAFFLCGKYFSYVHYVVKLK